MKNISNQLLKAKRLNLSLFLIFTIFKFSLAQNSLDNLQYNYISGTNQLQYITDGVSNSVDATDLETQPSTNYAYNAIGQLTKDEVEGILSIEWNVSGKVKKVSKDNDGDLLEDQTIEFTYDAMGNRIKNVM
jgi:hypothetical protein